MSADVVGTTMLVQQDEAEWETMQPEVSSPEWSLPHLKEILAISDTSLLDRLISDLLSAEMADLTYLECPSPTSPALKTGSTNPGIN